MSDNINDRVSHVEGRQDLLIDTIKEIKDLVKEQADNSQERHEEMQVRIQAMELQWARVRGITGTVLFIGSLLWSGLTYWFDHNK